MQRSDEGDHPLGGRPIFTPPSSYQRRLATSAYIVQRGSQGQYNMWWHFLVAQTFKVFVGEGTWLAQCVP